MGKLVQVATETVTSATASVTLTGIDSDDVYMVAINNVQLDTDTKSIQYRFTVSGTAQSTANYDYAHKVLRSNTSFANESATNQTQAFINSYTGTGTGTGETTQSILYLFNFNNSSEYSFVTKEQVTVDFNARLIGGQGGAVYTVAQSCDGIQFFASTDNIAGGTFKLYGLKK